MEKVLLLVVALGIILVGLRLSKREPVKLGAALSRRNLAEQFEPVFENKRVAEDDEDWLLSIQNEFGSFSRYTWRPSKLTKLGKVPFPVRSEVTQDAIIYEIFQRIGETNRYFVELGFDRPFWDLGVPNTRSLHDRGWQGLLLDAENENPKINLRKHHLYYSNIGSLFKSYRVPLELDYLSCDIDSNDWFVILGVLQASYRPRVVSMEVNYNWLQKNCRCDTNGKDWLGPAVALLDPTFAAWSRAQDPHNVSGAIFDCAWGVSPAAAIHLMERFGYVFAVASGLDMFFIRASEVPAGTRVPPMEARSGHLGYSGELEKYFTQVDLKPELVSWPITDLGRLDGLVDVDALLDGKSVSEAKEKLASTVASDWTNSLCWNEAFSRAKEMDVEE